MFVQTRSELSVNHSSVLIFVDVCYFAILIKAYLLQLVIFIVLIFIIEK